MTLVVIIDSKVERGMGDDEMMLQGVVGFQTSLTMFWVPFCLFFALDLQLFLFIDKCLVVIFQFLSSKGVSRGTDLSRFWKKRRVLQRLCIYKILISTKTEGLRDLIHTSFQNYKTTQVSLGRMPRLLHW